MSTQLDTRAVYGSASFDSSAVARSTGATVHYASAAVATAVPGSVAVPAAGARAGERSLSWVDRLTLVAIGVVVVVVTLPVLRGFGVRENERDALRMLRVLSAEPNGAHATLAAGQVSLAELASRDRVLPRRLEDLEMLPDGRLRRHGYLFDVARLEDGQPMLRAWPWEHAQTGRGAFVWTPQGGLLGHRNADGRFSGAQSPPDAADVGSAEWVSMRRP